MKTQILTIFTALVLSTGITATTYAATAKSENNIGEVSAINKIEVHGNVEVFISDGDFDKVEVNNKYYADNAVMRGRDGVLSITSYNTEKLVVWVTANDLRSVTAYDNAEIRSFGKLSAIEFNVDLYNNATAKLDLDAFSAKINVSDMAKADLSGFANEYDLKYCHAENINQKDFTAQHITKTPTINPMAVTSAQIDLFADL